MYRLHDICVVFIDTWASSMYYVIKFLGIFEPLPSYKWLRNTWMFHCMHYVAKVHYILAK